MGDYFRRFHCENKIRGTFLMPFLQRSRCGIAVKARINFDGIKVITIKPEPVFSSQPFRIEYFFPFLIVKAGASDKIFHTASVCFHVIEGPRCNNGLPKDCQ